MITISAFPYKNDEFDSIQQHEDVEEDFLDDGEEDYGDLTGSRARLSSPGVPLTSSDAFMR